MATKKPIKKTTKSTTTRRPVKATTKTRDAPPNQSPDAPPNQLLKNQLSKELPPKKSLLEN